MKRIVLGGLSLTAGLCLGVASYYFITRDTRPVVICLVALGANDFWRRARSIAEMRDDLVTMIMDCQKIGARVIVAGCFGDRDFWGEHSVEFESRRFDLAWRFAQMEREVVQEYNCLYLPNMQIDIKPNRLKPYWDMTDHPNSVGNEQIALRMLPYIKAALRNASTVN
jgi:lysophospholipase L1-like esterase